MRLKCNDILIRDFTINDASDLHIVLSDKEVMKYIEKPFDLSKTKNFIKKYGLISNPLIYAVQSLSSEKVIGHCIFHKYNEDAYELGWVLNREYWGKGIASMITENMIKYSRNNGIKKLIIECDDKQIVTKRIAEMHDFVYIESKNNVHLYELVL